MKITRFSHEPKYVRLPSDDSSGVFEFESQSMVALCNEDERIQENKIDISRQQLNWSNYLELAQPEDVHEESVSTKVVNSFKSKVTCSARCFLLKILRLFPILTWLPFYNIKSCILPDLVSGLTVGIMNVPQGMAYALLASLPPVYGLYTSFYPCLLYFIFGTSKHASVGTFAITSLMTSQLVEEFLMKHSPTIAPPSVQPADNLTTIATEVPMLEHDKVEVAIALACAVGIIQIIMGIFQLGNLCVYMSSEMVSGFFMACGVYVFTSQISNLFGLTFRKHHGLGSLIMNYYEFFTHLPETNFAILIISISSLSLLAIVKIFFDPHVQKKIRMPIPADLIIIIIATFISTYFDFEKNLKVDIIGEIPVGLKMPAAPHLYIFKFDMLPSCVSLAFIMFATSVSVGIVLGKKHKYSIDNNQELFAYGISCSLSSFFHCFPSSVSMSRSLLISTIGGKTLISTSVSALLILSVIVSIGSLFEHLPKCVLSAIIVVALRNIAKEFYFFKKTWKVSKLDAMVWLVSFFVTIFADIQFGLLSSILFSVLLIILKSQWANCCTLGNIPGTELYVDISKYKKAIEIEGLRIIQFGSNLNFTNYQYFLREVHRHAATHEKSSSDISSSDKEKTRSVILDLSCVSNIDSSGVQSLFQLIEEFKADGVSLFFASCREPVLSSIFSIEERPSFITDILFPSIHDAVIYAKI